MSMLPISHFTWQVLRVAKRSKRPLTGKEMRVSPTRKSRDGSFLDALVIAGLLEVVGVDEPNEKTKRLPTQFRTRYRLTARGEYAAEYGAYEREVKRENVSNEVEKPEPGKVRRSRRATAR